MKKKLITILIMLCFILSGCKESPLTESQVGPTMPPTPTVIPTAAATEFPPITITVTPAPEVNNDYLNFSSHTNPMEASYKTILADLSKLQDGKPVFVVQEQAADWSTKPFDGLVKNDIWGYDVRSNDISGIDLSPVEDFSDLSFNSDTIWPVQLPEGFDPNYILEFNKNPGLGIRALQDQGIDGSGIGIAIIDQPLLLDQEQYKDSLMLYEKIHSVEGGAQMHGPAVASIAVGKTIGVAPGAKLYFIASTFGHYSENSYDFDASVIAASILRVLEINKTLPENEKIRVISISRGYSRIDKGYQGITDAIDKANDENIFVITTSTSEYYNFNLFGMGRGYLDDPEDFNSYGPAGWAADSFYSNPDSFANMIMVPMGSRTYAACTGTDKYEIGREGGLSWAVPWCAGFYALCCQVKPDITPQEFIDVAKATAVTIPLEHDNKTYQFGKIINPAGVIEELKKN